jgi:glycosyltransferase involved in cell wall biosynthesis
MVGEHFGLAPLEALASGMTPVVPERSGTWSDICNNGNYCYSYKKPNPEELEEAVRRALEKPLIAPEDHVKKFAPDTFAKGILSVVKEVLNER